MLGISGRDRAEGGFMGYVKCLAQFIADARAIAMIEWKRKREAREFARIDERKKIAAGMFNR
jgi:hypothetical protein